MSRVSIHFSGEVRRRVLAAANLKASLHRNFVVAHSSPARRGMSRLSLRGSLHFIPQNELRGY
jgi:hypothetical protein